MIFFIFKKSSSTPCLLLKKVDHKINKQGRIIVFMKSAHRFNGGRLKKGGKKDLG